jgi:hypothetical protein
MAMTADQIIATTASAGTCLSALATFLTVKEVARQRRQSYLPDLAVPQVRVTCTPEAREKTRDGNVTETLKNPLATVWATEDSPAVGTISYRLSIPIVNVGLAAAIDVTLEWDYPVDETVKLLNDLAERLEAPFHLNYDDKFFGALSLRSQVASGPTLMWRNTRHGRIDYVLPPSTHSQPCQLNLPGTYILLVAVFYHLQSEAGSKNLQDDTWFDLPNLALELSFRDIANGMHKTSYEIALDVSSFTSDEISGALTAHKKQSSKRRKWFGVGIKQ